MSLVLPLDIYSPDQLSDLMLELQDIIGGMRDSAVRGSTTESPTPSSALNELLSKNNVQIVDSPKLEVLIKDLDDALKKSPTAHILLAAMPGRIMRRQIVNWFRTQIHPLSLVTFAARSDLGGGSVVQIGSRLYDLSFRRTILDNKARITEIAGV